jgi:hypothetical protein
MKKINICGIVALLISTGLSSCQKEFDPKSYAPPLSIGGFSNSKEIAKGNLVGYWAFNGSLTDSVSNTTAVSTGTSFASPGFEGKSLQGALNGYVLATPSSGITSMKSFTITEWYNSPPPSTGIIGIFSLAKTNGFWGNIDVFFENNSSNTNGMVRVHIAKGDNDNTFATDNVQNLFNKWVNFTISYDAASSTCTLYIGGAKVSSAVLSGLSGDLNFNHIGNLVFGCVQFQTTPSQTSVTDSQPWASYLTGQMDELRIYNKALSATEISAIVALEARGK